MHTIEWSDHRIILLGAHLVVEAVWHSKMRLEHALEGDSRNCINFPFYMNLGTKCQRKYLWHLQNNKIVCEGELQDIYIPILTFD